MEPQKMKELIADAVADTDLRPEEIPAIDLYLDQITSLVAGKLQEGSPRFYDRVLTKTMVNNYSKDGLLSPISGKKYSKEHFLQMLLVYSMKNTLSIGEIKRVLQSIYRLPEYDTELLRSVYSRLLDTKQGLRENTEAFMEKYIERAELDTDNEQDFLVMLLGLSAMSAYLKSIVQTLLEEHYPDLNLEKEREERERREEQKRIKEEKKKAASTAKAEAAKSSSKKKKESEGKAADVTSEAKPSEKKKKASGKQPAATEEKEQSDA